MSEAPVELLQRVPLFADFERRELERLARSFKERTFESGSTVAGEGRAGAGFFVIESGEATVTVRDAERGKLGPGDYFGEIALIDRGARSATIIANGELRCQGLSAIAFRPLVQTHPEIAWPLLEALVERLRDAETSAGGELR
jgi:CRP/FNR family transcriptional regulator, cyclic AMP receptor protein